MAESINPEMCEFRINLFDEHFCKNFFNDILC